MSDARTLLRAAQARLIANGVESAEHDAAALLAYVTGTPRSALALVEVSDADVTTFDALIERRAAREPL